MSSQRFGYTLIIPAVVIIVTIAFFPIVRCIWLSLCENDILGGVSTRFIGLENYKNLLGDKIFHKSFFNTLFFTVISVTCEFLLGLIFALLLDQSFRGRGIARACVLIPWALPPAIIAMAWRWIFNDTYGVFGDMLMKVGIVHSQIAWLGKPGLAMFSVIFADVWKTTPFICIILLAGLQSIPRDLFEAISIDGANSIRRFTMITLPLLRPYIVLALIFRTIQAFGVFDLIWVLTGGGPAGSTQTVSLYIYDMSFRYLNLGYGSAITIVVFFMLFVTAMMVTILGRGQAEY